MTFQPEPSAKAVVYLVDDDASVRRGISRLIRSAGYHVEVFGSTDDFLRRKENGLPSCLVLDIKMPGSTGMDLQQLLLASGQSMPIIFLSGHADVPTSVQAMKQGAFDFLTKPVTAEDLLAAIRKAIDADILQKKRDEEVAEVQSRMSTLTNREAQVFSLVVTGMLNKQIAAELGTTEKTIKVHRARVMEKMGADSLAELVQLANRIPGLPRKSRPGLSSAGRLNDAP